MRTTFTLLAAVALTVPSFITPTSSADAHRRYHKHGHQYASQWQGRDGRTYCRRSDGTIGLVVGGVGGALVGRAIDTRGDRAVGTLLGAGAGALLGREVQQNRSRCR